MSLPSTSEVPAPHLISSLNTYDIRHVSRDQECSPGLTKVKNQTRFKRSIATRPNSRTEPTRQDKPVEWWRALCGVILDPDRVFKFNGQSDGNDVSLDLTLGLVSE
ncbi:hypothetical protein OIU76_013781 [Salix suchowensis]|nr:hypothetical protein OIU76_013781 [Salix suchowensis]